MHESARRLATTALLGAMVGPGLGWGLFGGPEWWGGDGSSGAPESPCTSAPRAPSEGDAPAAPDPTRPSVHPAAETDGEPSSASPEGARCPACPASADLARCDHDVALLRERLQDAARRAADAEAAASGPRYDAPTAAGRRVLAARKGNLLVEFPDWNDRLTLRDGVADENGLSAGQAQALEGLYADSNARLRDELQRLYGELVGDPQAGRTSSTNALLHDLMSLSPQDACRQRLPALLQAVAEERPLPALGPDPLACEQAVGLVFQAVDALDARALTIAGEPARKALWSGSSTFEFGSPGR